LKLNHNPKALGVCEDYFIKYVLFIINQISKKFKHIPNLLRIWREFLEKNLNVLPNCFAREFQETHLMFFGYIRWSALLKRISMFYRTALHENFKKIISCFFVIYVDEDHNFFEIHDRWPGNRWSCYWR